MQRLRELQGTPLDEFVSNYLISSTVEREFQVAIQAAIDVAQIVLADLGARTPRDYADTFAQLGTLGVCPHALAERLVSMARFRNVLVHLYLEVDPHRVYKALQNGLPDLDEFAQCIAEYILSR